MRIRLAAVAAAFAVLAASGCAEPGTGPPASGVKPSAVRAPRAVNLGTAVRWWWERTASMPKAVYFDPRLCGLKQPYRIWLLGGGAPKGRQARMCNIPTHRPVLAPVVNELVPSVPNAPRPPSLRGRISVTLDGRPLTPVRVTNDRPYSISAAVGNPIGLKAGRQSVTDRGYWLLIPAGLPPGRHRLTIRTPALPASAMFSRNWTLDAW